MNTQADIRIQERMGERIAKCLHVRYETHRELAELLGVKESTLSRYISGKQTIPYRHLFAIALHLGVSLSYLLGEKEKENDGDLVDAFNKRIEDGWDIVWRFDPRDCTRLLDCLHEVGEGRVSMDALHDACGVPKSKLNVWFELMRRGEWDELALAIKKYGNALDNE